MSWQDLQPPQCWKVVFAPATASLLESSNYLVGMLLVLTHMQEPHSTILQQHTKDKLNS